MPLNTEMLNGIDLTSLGGAKGIRCSCGQVTWVSGPCICIKCGYKFKYWLVERELISFSKLKLDHILNIIRHLGEQAERFPSGEPRTKIEIALDLFYEEIASRDQEITQNTGIMSALTKGLNA